MTVTPTREGAPIGKVVTMNHPMIPIAVANPPAGASRQRKRQAPKGRRVQAAALAEAQGLLGAALIGGMG